MGCCDCGEFFGASSSGVPPVPESAFSSALGIVAPVTLAAAPARTTLASFVINKAIAGPLIILADASFHALLAPDRARLFVVVDGIDRHALFLTTPFGASPLIPDPEEWFVATALNHRTVQAAGAHTVAFEAHSVFSIANNISIEAGRLIAFEYPA